ncbi:IS110 family transposase [Legionella sp. km535]|uniref:IS110 family transposase n=1 Tax=Legionella sp. km535 TaxID=2498107 RepID=UPI000F8C4DC9|nr:IS110 family transposase [Legionella sp. km535]RUR14557.1 IS110 family transposase [Legionella sp. km535]
MDQTEYVGVDVAKDKFDVATFINNRYKHSVYPNDAKGHAEFAAWLTKNSTSPWVCMEATGHYSEGIADFLLKKSIKVSVVNPYQIKNFAKASLARNKNDIIDGRVIREFCKCMQPRVYVTTSEAQKQLKGLMKLLDMLKGQLVQLNNQLHSLHEGMATDLLIKWIKNLEKEVSLVEQKMTALINEEPMLNRNMRLITSIKGIGKLTAFRVLALMPDVSSFQTAKQFAAYIGITPKQHQSGKLFGKTTISRLGDSRLRKALYMAALVAKRHNKGLSAFVTRLQNNGKTPKTIVCAVMRKLAHIIFGVLKSKLPFNENLSCV